MLLSTFPFMLLTVISFFNCCENFLVPAEVWVVVWVVWVHEGAKLFIGSVTP